MCSSYSETWRWVDDIQSLLQPSCWIYIRHASNHCPITALPRMYSWKQRRKERLESIILQMITVDCFVTNYMLHALCTCHLCIFSHVKSNHLVNLHVQFWYTFNISSFKSMLLAACIVLQWCESNAVELLLFTVGCCPDLTNENDTVYVLDLSWIWESASGPCRWDVMWDIVKSRGVVCDSDERVYLQLKICDYMVS